MSALPIETPRASAPNRKSPVTFGRLAEMKRAGDPIVMVTAYDHPSAEVAQNAGVDLILVGDSAAMVVLGHSSTVPITMNEMIMLCSAVRRGAATPLIIGDMPFGSYESSNETAVMNAQRFIKEAGCDAVKLEGGGTSVERARAIISAGIPVMGHVGLTPQTAAALGGFKAQGRTAAAAQKVIRDAQALEDAGCFSVVVEAVPAAVGEELTKRLGIPTIGIGAGRDTDGQVLVYHDLLGLRDGPNAKFVKRYADLRGQAIAAVTTYSDEVRAGIYPGPEHVYSIEPGELSELRETLGSINASEDQS
ncbi:MAG: 3-methyl-2-oxobutanoate hydroxymethyltransferase [Solirubrobacterales bacterium]|nr:3-methyl-2-oxobutanoate hydroxymethyltransferase [Solirubrobacterales bacterium]